MAMSRRASAMVARGSRGIHVTPAATTAINFASVVGKVENENDRARLLNLQKVHDTAKSSLLGVNDTADAIDFAEWGAKVSDAGLVSEIKGAYEAVSLPAASDTTMVDHPAWDLSLIHI